MTGPDVGALLLESAWIAARIAAGGALAVAMLAVLVFHVRIHRGPEPPPRVRRPGTARFVAMLAALLVVAVITALTPGQAATWLPAPLEAAVAAAGALSSLAGATFVIWAAAALGANLAVGPTVRGDERATLVTAGPFALVRHPLYAALGLLAAGATLAWGSVAGLVALLVFYPPTARARAAREEEALAAAWGTAWNEYAARTPRFVPRL